MHSVTRASLLSCYFPLLNAAERKALKHHTHKSHTNTANMYSNHLQQWCTWKFVDNWSPTMQHSYTADLVIREQLKNTAAISRQLEQISVRHQLLLYGKFFCHGTCPVPLQFTILHQKQNPLPTPSMKKEVGLLHSAMWLWDDLHGTCHLQLCSSEQQLQFPWSLPWREKRPLPWCLTLDLPSW